MTNFQNRRISWINFMNKSPKPFRNSFGSNTHIHTDTLTLALYRAISPEVFFGNSGRDGTHANSRITRDIYIHIYMYSVDAWVYRAVWAQRFVPTRHIVDWSDKRELPCRSMCKGGKGLCSACFIEFREWRHENGIFHQEQALDMALIFSTILLQV